MTPLHAWPWKVKIGFSTKHNDNFRFIIRWGHLWPSLVENCILLKTAKLKKILKERLYDSLFLRCKFVLWFKNYHKIWLSNEIFCVFLAFLVLAQSHSKVERNGILCLKFWQDLHENDADEAMTSPCNMSIAEVKSSNVTGIYFNFIFEVMSHSSNWHVSWGVIASSASFSCKSCQNFDQKFLFF